MFSVNAKMKKTGKKYGIKLVNFTIPALKSATGLVTCPNAGACAAGCYARQGAYNFKAPKTKHEKNLALTLLPNFKQLALDELLKIKPDVVRIHDSGDFYNAEYLAKWIDIASAMPDVKFYAYTKMVHLIKQTELPKNLQIIFSLGGRQDLMIDQKTDRHSRVFETVDALQAAGYIDASDDDMLALTDNPKIGLVYHGGKNYENTNWKNVA